MENGRSKNGNRGGSSAKRRTNESFMVFVLQLWRLTKELAFVLNSYGTRCDEAKRLQSSKLLPVHDQSRWLQSSTTSTNPWNAYI